MRKFALLLAVLLLPLTLWSQNTSVTLSVTDAGSNAWNGATYTVTFVPNSNDPIFSHYTWTGGTLSRVISGTLGSAGTATFNVPDNATISPAGSTWQFSVTPLASYPYSYPSSNTTVTGASQSVSLSPPALSFQCVNTCYGYNTNEVTLAAPGTIFYNVTTGAATACNQWSGSAWGSCGGGGAAAPTVTVSTSGPVTVAGTGSGFWYNNSSGAITFNLPTITSGMLGYQFCFRNYTSNTGVVTLQSPASTLIDLNGATATAAGTLVSGGAAGDSVCIVPVATTLYMAYVGVGTWTNN